MKLFRGLISILFITLWFGCGEKEEQSVELENNSNMVPLYTLDGNLHQDLCQDMTQPLLASMNYLAEVVQEKLSSFDLESATKLKNARFQYTIKTLDSTTVLCSVHNSSKKMGSITIPVDPTNQDVELAEKICKGLSNTTQFLWEEVTTNLEKLIKDKGFVDFSLLERLRDMADTQNITTDLLKMSNTDDNESLTATESTEGVMTYCELSLTDSLQ